jgi:L-aspartate oxidase
MRSLLGGGDIGGTAIELPPVEADSDSHDELPFTRESLQRTMTVDAGVLRSAESLDRAGRACAALVEGEDPKSWELRNLATVGRALSAAALAREESRGAHTRSDFPALRPDLRARFVIGSQRVP